jgi:hypothetical protein
LGGNLQLYSDRKQEAISPNTLSISLFLWILSRISFCLTEQADCSSGYLILGDYLSFWWLFARWNLSDLVAAYGGDLISGRHLISGGYLPRTGGNLTRST